MPSSSTPVGHRVPWNKGKLVGPKPPLKLREIWEIRIRLKLSGHLRDLALFNLAVDSKLRGCDLVRVRVNDIAHGDSISPRAMVIQRKTQHSVQFEVTEATRVAVAAWMSSVRLRAGDYLFPAWSAKGTHLSTRQYGRLVSQWVSMIGLDPVLYGTHSLRRTKATLIYRRTKNLRAVQLLLGHRKLDSTVRYLGIEMEEALEIAEATEV